MERCRFYLVFVITLCARMMIVLACEEHRNNQTNSNEQGNNETVSISQNCTFTFEEDPVRQKFESKGRAVSVNASATLWVNSTITPSYSMKWRTGIHTATAFLVWGDFQQENGDHVQFNRRVFHGSTKCTPAPVVIHDNNNEPKSVLIGLKSSSGKANVKFAPIVLDPSFWMISQDVLFCQEVLDYVATSDIRLQALKDILISDAATYLNYVNRVEESNVHICNILQRFSTHCKGYYAVASCGNSEQ